MFYAHFVLSKKGPLARIWLAAHWDKKLTRSQVFETNITSSVEAILEPKVKLALRTSGHLLLGVVRIHSRQAKYLLSDCNEAFVKIKMAFRPGADLTDETHRDTTSLAAITLSDNIHDFESTLADINDMDPFGIAINQSRPEDITMREEFGEPNLGRPDDDFGDSTFEDAGDRDFVGEPINMDSMEDNNEADMTLTNELVKNQSAHVFPEMPSSVGMENNDSDFADVMDVDYVDSESVENLENMFQDTVNPVSESLSGVESRLMENTIDNQMDTTVDNSMTISAIPKVTELAPVVEEELRGPINHPTIPEPLALVVSQPARQLPQFVLPPIDRSLREHRRAPKRKRKLLIDEHKSIPSDVMKLQMQDTTEITTRLDLAPPTRKLMLWKETGNVEALFTTPGRAIPSRILQKLFYRNMKTVAVPNDAPDGLPVIPGVKRCGGFLNLDEDSNDSPSKWVEPNEVTPHIIPHNISNINEVSETDHQEHHLHEGACSAYSANYDCWSAGHATPHRDDDEPIEFGDDMSVAPLSKPIELLTGDQSSLDIGSPKPVQNLLTDNSITHSSSVNSSMLGSIEKTRHLSLGSETRLSDNVDSMINKSIKSNESIVSDTPNKLQNNMVMLDQQLDKINEEYPMEITQEGLEKRSEIMVHVLRNAIKQGGTVDFHLLTVSNNKKQAASKFYTLLLLGKQKKLKMSQDTPQSNIIITYVETD